MKKIEKLNEWCLKKSKVLRTYLACCWFMVACLAVQVFALKFLGFGHAYFLIDSEIWICWLLAYFAVGASLMRKNYPAAVASFLVVCLDLVVVANVSRLGCVCFLTALAMLASVAAPFAAFGERYQKS